MLLAATSPAAPPLRRPDPKPIAPDPNTINDEQIGQAIRKGAAWLNKFVDPKTHRIAGLDKVAGMEVVKDESLLTGLDALTVYALMQSGLALRDEPKLSIKGPEIKAMVEALRGFDMTKGHFQTYGHGLRATGLALYIANRDPLAKGAEDLDLRALQEDARWCMYACDGGAYNYEMPPNAPRSDRALLDFYKRLRPESLPGPEGGWDNSNSQYGLLGVWSAAEVGVDVPLPYWALVDQHWSRSQHSNGTWAYSRDDTDDRLSMTCAGLASLLVTYDYLVPPDLTGPVGRDAFSPAVRKGLEWFERGDNSVKVKGINNLGYTMYGIERVGLASGQKQFGTHDWYTELATFAVHEQKPDGSWNGDPVETAYFLLFLSRGRHPVAMNKLRFVGYWDNRPRDLANLTTYTSKVLERQLNWQIVRSTSDWTQWTDSPVLCISSHAAPNLSKDDLSKIRSYVESGGVLFTQADGDSAQFNDFARKLAKDLFNQELVAVPANHPLLTTASVYNIKPAPVLKMVTNGARILMLHSPKDITRWWQIRDDVRHKADFQIGVNLFVYAGGKRDLRNRSDPVWVAPVTTPALGTIKVARLRYPGNWDPEPGAWKRYANWFARQTSFKVDIREAKLNELSPRQADVAVLTGTARQNFSSVDGSVIKTFVDAGGVLFIDVTGGTGQFESSARELLRLAFPGVTSQPVVPFHPLIATRGHGMEDLSKRRLRGASAERLGRTGGALEILSSGKGHVVFSPIDVTSGLLGTDTAGIVGYEPHYAEALAKNLLFWTIDGQFDR